MSQPASNCGYCTRPGTLSLDQRTHQQASRTPGGMLSHTLRFHCSCGNIWVAPKHEAETLGRFLDKARLR